MNRVALSFKRHHIQILCLLGCRTCPMFRFSSCAFVCTCFMVCIYLLYDAFLLIVVTLCYVCLPSATSSCNFDFIAMLGAYIHSYWICTFICCPFQMASHSPCPSESSPTYLFPTPSWTPHQSKLHDNIWQKKCNFIVCCWGDGHNISIVDHCTTIKADWAIGSLSTKRILPCHMLLDGRMDVTKIKIARHPRNRQSYSSLEREYSRRLNSDGYDNDDAGALAFTMHSEWERDTTSIQNQMRVGG